MPLDKAAHFVSAPLRDVRGGDDTGQPPRRDTARGTTCGAGQTCSLSFDKNREKKWRKKVGFSLIKNAQIIIILDVS